MSWLVRSAQPGDLPQMFGLVDRASATGQLPIDLADIVVDLGACESNVVATVGDHVVAALVGRLDGPTGRIICIAIDHEWRGRGIGSALLAYTEEAFLKFGVRRIEALLSEGQVGSAALINRGFSVTTGLALYEKDEPLLPTAFTVLESWGGELVAPSAWTSFVGLQLQRDIVEDRLLAPLLDSDRAERFGVEPPSAMLLFGPPGTGKTSFAKAIAGRLGWPFVELLPSKLGSNGAAKMADELHNAFDSLLSLEHVVVFIDEVDDIASSRSARPDTQAVVNELLKAIIRVRESPGRLLICATNSIGALDAAVIRPGRFDLVIPIGAPDESARGALLTGMLSKVAAADVDVDELIELSDGLTPADMASAIQRAAAAAFTAARSGVGPETLTTDNLIDAMRSAMPTISTEDRELFDRETEKFSRL